MTPEQENARDLILLDPGCVHRAVQWIAKNCPADDFTALFEYTGARPPRYRFIDIEGRLYPTKAFGLLMLRLAGDHVTKGGDQGCTSNTMAQLIEAHGYRDMTRKNVR